MTSVINSAVVITLAFLAVQEAGGGTYEPQPDFGYPAGLIPDCPGVLKNASISPRTMKDLQIALHRITSTGKVLRKMIPVENAPEIIANEKYIDLKNKKTVFYAAGYLDSSAYPFSQAIGTSYSKRGYNVFISETNYFFSYIYPKAVRLVRVIGKKMGEFLVRLTKMGLKPENIELVGASLGAHEVSYAAKYFYEATGKKVARVTGLDPAGPCFRSLSTENKLFRTDADKVDIVHTNIDGFGTAEILGHIDYYVNGGEYQPNDIPYIPCLVLCSHIRAMIYWWQALEHPKKFIAVQCNTVQEARFAKCFNNTQTNYLGIEAKFDRPGLYYLATDNEFPYFKDKDGLKKDNEIYTKVTKLINSDDNFDV